MIPSVPVLRVLVVLIALAGCAVNPATGRREWQTMSHEDEIELGRRLDHRVVDAMGGYEDPRLERYVAGVGLDVTQWSERPSLPWTFRVIDDATVNAFALPGGFVYVTRGLLAHLQRGSELAAVLAHEIGHVTARHGVDQLRRAQQAQRRTFVFRVFDPRNRHVGRIASDTAALVLLRHSRDHEHEADDLGLRYVRRAGHDPRGFVDVLQLLADVGAASGDDQPTWLSTHPEPEARRARISAAIARLPPAPDDQPRNDPFLSSIDGLVFGEDPRVGFFVGGTFVHPTFEFRIDLPLGWAASHTRDSVVAVARDDEVILFVGEADAETTADADAKFFADPDVRRGERRRIDVEGVTVLASGFTIPGSGGGLAGLVNFLSLGDRVLVMVALGPVGRWQAHVEPAARAFASVRRLRDQRLLGIAPMRINLVRLERPTTLEAFAREHPSVVDATTLARINRVDPGQPLEAGRVVKKVVGFNPARAAASLGLEPATPAS